MPAPGGWTFHVDGVGTSRETLALTGGGRLARADLFDGTLSDADVSIEIDRGTLRASYNGGWSTIDPEGTVRGSSISGLTHRPRQRQGHSCVIC
jgi:hypothetical protein